MKDNFSIQSDNYAKYRPAYPTEFYDYLYSLIPASHVAWDCGTGNGQVAFELAKKFDHVFASDLSESQIKNALQSKNIVYSIQAAEQTFFEKDQFDLIIVAQAIHWFDFDKFYSEVRRTGNSNAILCVLGYGKIEISEEMDRVINYFYRNVIGSYWDKERKYIDENYKTIPFPFQEYTAPDFVNKIQWSLDHLIGYLNTWSAVKHFISKNNYNPLDALMKEIEILWGDSKEREVRFPLLLRIGKIH
ncbi:MAG: methyltransferase domain-containing protein [Bacteroidetes bacterium]|nr:methyltransferase domain-containing protein [Bacteroidota bacterium]